MSIRYLSKFAYTESRINWCWKITKGEKEYVLQIVRFPKETPLFGFDKFESDDDCGCAQGTVMLKLFGVEFIWDYSK